MIEDDGARNHPIDRLFGDMSDSLNELLTLRHENLLFKNQFDNNKINEGYQKLMDMIRDLRQQNAELIADGERLVKFAADTAAHDWREVITMTYQGHLELVDMIAQHTALKKKYAD